MRKIFRTAIAVVVTTAFVFTVYRQPAEAIPNPQETCDFDVFTFQQTSVAVPGTAVTISNGTIARLVVVNFSADTGVDPDAEVRIAYSIDGGSPQEDVFGPANLANHQEFWEARHVMAVIPLGPGTHTIQPVVRVSRTQLTWMRTIFRSTSSRCIRIFR